MHKEKSFVYFDRCWFHSLNKVFVDVYFKEDKDLHSLPWVVYHCPTVSPYFFMNFFPWHWAGNHCFFPSLVFHMRKHFVSCFPLDGMVTCSYSFCHSSVSPTRNLVTRAIDALKIFPFFCHWRRMPTRLIRTLRRLANLLCTLCCLRLSFFAFGNESSNGFLSFFLVRCLNLVQYVAEFSVTLNCFWFPLYFSSTVSLSLVCFDSNLFPW